MSDYEIKNLREVEDMAVKHGFSEMQEARFPRSDLGAETTGLAYHVVRPGKPATRRWCRASGPIERPGA